MSSSNQQDQPVSELFVSEPLESLEPLEPPFVDVTPFEVVCAIVVIALTVILYCFFPAGAASFK